MRTYILRFIIAVILLGGWVNSYRLKSQVTRLKADCGRSAQQPIDGGPVALNVDPNASEEKIAVGVEIQMEKKQAERYTFAAKKEEDREYQLVWERWAIYHQAEADRLTRKYEAMK